MADTTIFVLEHCERWEGCSIMGLFSTIENAKELAENVTEKLTWEHHEDGSVSSNDFKVDQRYVITPYVLDSGEGI